MSRQTYLPDGGDAVGRVHDFLAAHDQTERDAPEPRYFLEGTEPGDRVELPQEAYRVLRQVVEAMHHNLAVTVVPQSLTLTTQQAAELLGVSRPTVIKLLDQGLIPFERAGSHRRILLHDLLAYRARRREQQYETLAAMAADTATEDDPDVVLEELRSARRAVASRRRGDA